MSFISWIESVASSVGNFVKKEAALIVSKAPAIEDDVAAGAQVAENDLETAANVADNAVNALKNFVTTPKGAAIEAVITMVPGIGPFVPQVLAFLPKLMVDLNWAKAAFSKSGADVVVEGITKAVLAATPDVKATNLAVLQAHLNTLISGLPIQASLSQAPIVHIGVQQAEPDQAALATAATSEVTDPNEPAS